MDSQNQAATTAPLERIVRQLTDELDATFRRWDIWRSENKNWCAKVEHDEQSEIFVSPSLIELLSLASKWRPLPLVPRRPRRLYRDNFRAIKGVRKWELYYGDEFYCGGLSTKTQATAAAERLSEQSRIAVEEWDENFGWSLTKRENVEFRFAS